MDLLTHILLTRRFVGKAPALVIAGILPDAPFYLTYPAWVIKRRQLGHAIREATWPNPPVWMATLHHAFHSVPVALLGASLVRLVAGRWPRGVLKAWLLHIAIDIPTHTRHPWGPQVLWPFSTFAVNGVSWADAATRLVSWGIRK